MSSRKHERAAAAAVPNSFWSSGASATGTTSRTTSTSSSSSGAPLTFQAFEASVSDAWDICDVDIGGHQTQAAAALGVIDVQPGSRRSLTLLPPAEAHKPTSRVPPPATAAPHSRDQPNCVQSSDHHSSSSSVPTSTSIAKQKTKEKQDTNIKLTKLETLLDSPSFDLEELRKLAWPGISSRARSRAWKTLCGYLPPPTTDVQGTRRCQMEVVQRKRDEYSRYVKQYFATRDQDVHGDTYRQIHIDIPRMSPVVGLFQQRCVQEIFERILYIWAIRHPASGYVQGINDLVTPFFLVFLHDTLRCQDETTSFDVVLSDNLDVEHKVPLDDRDVIEADCFWCLTKILDGIQDNYTFAQPGIQLKVKQLEELIRRIDGELHTHLVTHDVIYLQFAFRWMNNLLMRELPIRATIRLWDTYLAQADGFSHFHLYVCAAFLVRWKTELMKKTDFHVLLMFLQNLPTAKWADADIDLLVAEAYRLSYLFADAPSHLSSLQTTGTAVSS